MENQQELKREMEKDSTLVTPSMRSLHFEKFGMYAEDNLILAWYNSQQKEPIKVLHEMTLEEKEETFPIQDEPFTVTEHPTSKEETFTKLDNDKNRLELIEPEFINGLKSDGIAIDYSIFESDLWFL